MAGTNPYEGEAWDLGGGTAMRPGGLELTRELLDAAGLPERARVLDLGCGTGSSLVLLRELGFDATGIDISEKLVERARGTASGARLIVGDPFEALDGVTPFDAVLAQCTLSEIALQHGLDATAALVARITVPGGAILLTDVYCKDGNRSTALPTDQGWISLFESYGFGRIWERDCQRELTRFAVELAWNGHAADIGDARWCPALANMGARDVGYLACVLRRRDD